MTVRIEIRKTKKGLIIGFKEPNKREKTYIYDPNYPVDLYKIAYEQEEQGKTYSLRQLKAVWKDEQKKASFNEAWKGFKNYEQRVRKKGTLHSMVQTGKTSATFDPNSMNAGTVKKLYEDLLGPLVLDKELLELVIKNADKFKHRFDYATTCSGTTDMGETGKPLGHIEDRGNRTVTQYVIDYIMDERGLIRKGRRVDSNWRWNAARHLNLPLGMIEHFRNGNIRQTHCTVTFTRGMK